MPMRKDMLEMAEEQQQTGAEQYHRSKQQARHRNRNCLDEQQRPDMPVETADVRQKPHNYRASTNNGAYRARGISSGEVDTVEVDVRSSSNVHKMSIPSLNLESKAERSRDRKEPQAIETTAQKQKPNTGSKAQKLHQFPPISAFDDTTSLDSGFLQDEFEEDNQTVVLKMDSHLTTRTHGPTPDPYQRNRNNHPSFGAISPQEYHDLIRPGWEDEVANERQQRAEHDARRSFSKQNRNRLYAPPQDRVEESIELEPIPTDMNLLAVDRSRRMSIGNESMPETPSRTQSVPPQQAQAKLPGGHHVPFISSPQDLAPNVDSPTASSAELALDEGSRIPARPASAFPAVQYTPLPQRPQHTRPAARDRADHKQAIASVSTGRFHAMPQAPSPMLQNQPKVSAPDSDIQDSSEDERMRSERHRTTSRTVQSTMRATNQPSLKRSHDDVDAYALLDYDLELLSTKRLSDLQNEPFSYDPRDLPAEQPIPGQVDLAQELSALGKLPHEAQREMFRRQTDNEWATTGQWFIDEFQRNFGKLTEVRLNRRRIALQYENKIRRRQREVQHYQEGVATELKALYDGGSGLLKDRKHPGSRSGTPVRHARA